MGEFIHAFEVLKGSRQLGFGQGPIQLTQIEAYLKLFGPPSCSVEIFVDLLCSMDYAYLEEVNKDNATNAGSPRGND